MAVEPTSPANAVAQTATRRTRIPMSVPRQKLSVPEIPGYYLYWFRGDARVQRALEAGYEFVSSSEASLNSFAIGGDAKQSGNTDMGTRVSIVSGEELGPDGQPERLYLMKLKEEWHQEDLALQAESSEAFVGRLRAGKIGSENDAAGDTATRYVGSQTRSDMFMPKPIRRT